MSLLASRALKSGKEDKQAKRTMSEKVQVLASNVYKEFERLITKYDADVVEILMPLTVSILENLEELYKTKQSNELEIELLHEDFIGLKQHYEKEKSIRKQTDEKILAMEFSFDEEKKQLKEKVNSLESALRLQESRAKSHGETVARYEDKVEELKAENGKLYERYTEVFKSHAELLGKTRASSYNSTLNFSFDSLGKASLRTAVERQELVDKNENEHTQSRLGPDMEEKSQQAMQKRHQQLKGEIVADILSNDQATMKARRSPYHFLPEENDIQGFSQCDEDSEEEGPSPDYNGGIRKEIESLIRENQELIDTKNALNVVKDDLITKLDQMTSDNDELREDVRLYMNKLTDLTARVASLEEALHKTKIELDCALQKNQSSTSSPSSENSNPPLDTSQRTFSRSEMAVLLQERNHYKEKLLELQDALVYKDNMRLQQQHPDSFSSSGQRQQISTASSPKKSVFPSQSGSSSSSLWNFFRNLIKTEEDLSSSIEMNVKKLRGRFKLEIDRSQLYGWSVPRQLIEDGSTVRCRLPIPLRAQKIFEQKDEVIAICQGRQGDPDQDGGVLCDFFWCLMRSAGQKCCFLLRLGLAESCPELTVQYSTKLKLPTTPQSLAEVPALIFAIKGLNSLRAPVLPFSMSSFSSLGSSSSASDRSRSSSSTPPSSPAAKIVKIIHTKVLIKPKSHVGSKTLWIGCEKNQVAIFVLYDDNKLEGRMATVTLPSEFVSIRYCLGRVIVVLSGGQVAIFELNRELSQWELSQCVMVDVLAVSTGRDKNSKALLGLVCCDNENRRVWLPTDPLNLEGASACNCLILDLASDRVVARLSVPTDVSSVQVPNNQCRISTITKAHQLSLILIGAAEIGTIFGFDCASCSQLITVDLKSAIFDLIEPIVEDHETRVSLVDICAAEPDRVWVITDSGLVVVMTTGCLVSQMGQSAHGSRPNSDYNFIDGSTQVVVDRVDRSAVLHRSLGTDELFISSHAFAQSTSQMALLAYHSNSLCGTSEVGQTPMVVGDGCYSYSTNHARPGCLLSVIGAGYVNLNNSAATSDRANLDKSNYALIWKI